MLHNRWFSDLDIFHKGYARARDEDGWMHVDRAGVPAYAKRYSAIEPFYNGQARVERFDGGLEVIRENGDIVSELRGSQRSLFSELSREMVGFWQTHTIATAVCLGVFEQLPSNTELIAERCGLETKKTERLLKALGELRLVVCQNNEWHVTAKGEYLLVSNPMTLVDAAVEYSGPFLDLWGKLPEALRSNSGWRAADIFETVSIAEDRLAPHHRMLQSYAMHDYNAIPKVLALNGDERVLDAGGGTGALGQFLLDTYPGLSVTIFDRPDVVDHATNLAKSNMDWRSGDLFSSWGVEADVIILARVLHDWPDGDALKILHQAREALSNGGKLFIIEMLLPDNGFAGALCDLHLLVATGGQERTEHDYNSLLAIAGFTLTEVRQTETLPRILVAVADDLT
jgi:2-polyprenyl-3-methyl-5-hydroxy-6-metoxy-1,4-benzoquinol methylase